MSEIIKESAMSDYGTDSNGKKWTDYDTIKCPNGEIIDMQALIDDQKRAEVCLQNMQPFFSGFVGKLKPIYTFRVKTQATDGVHLFINPYFTAKLSLEEKVFVLAHEIMHCVLNHLRRGQDLHHDHEKSNIAADYECNITLAKEATCGMGLLRYTTMEKLGALIDKKYDGWSYEKIYAANPPGPNNGSQSQNGQQNQNGSGQGGSGQSGQSGSSGGNAGGGNQQQQYSPDYIKGWEQAKADAIAGKLKL